MPCFSLCHQDLVSQASDTPPPRFLNLFSFSSCDIHLIAHNDDPSPLYTSYSYTPLNDNFILACNLSIKSIGDLDPILVKVAR